jgi:DNA-binding CsgD family transcriptional regulator
MNNKKAVAHFRQLCCLGLPQESLGPALLEALHHIVPSLHNRMVWCDEQRTLTAQYCEAPELYLYGKLFFENYDGRLPDFPGTAFILSRPRGVGHYLPIVTTNRYFNGTYHNEIERPVGGHYFLDMAVADDGGNLAAIILTREAHAKPYTRHELDTLDNLIPYVAHAIRGSPPRPNDNNGLGEGRSDLALLVADVDGGLLYATAKAQQWLSMAFFASARAGEISRKLSAELPMPVKSLCQSLSALTAGHAAPTPSFTVRNAWGLFRFSAALLRSQNPAPSSPIAITIEHREHRTVTLMRHMWSLGLSTAQKQVCLTLMKGHSTEAQIAQQLGISQTTVRDHLDKIYGKLDVHSREDLVRRLSGFAQTQIPHNT